ncbi:phenol hydroxylase subunit P4 [Pseudothauera rhizosphaerae]|uniref:Phenol hydroxylase n=1 Tax=Pseudothauera rhizosphaerae TaxID=2565932 RepID=A0A4S4A8S6_9RHOO|nr:phenol hydroxylase subunit P4 [Pseudothauera rhizosphaerae]THF55183.1 phenol hydroxylase [Pseudothauera rhizosphaerae]
MPVKSLKKYVGVPRDVVANFHGKQVVYVSWDQHLLFAAPLMLCLPPQTTFRELVDGPLAALIAPDPDAAAVDWSTVQWLKANQPWVPDFDRSLADNGIVHKDQLRLSTPGLNSLRPAA